MRSIKQQVLIVLPAYNAEKTLEKTYHEIPQKYKKNIILVDDGSQDNTVNIAKSLRIQTICHKKNKGYGANQKTCYREALKRKADIVVMLHPDYQYDPSYIGQLIAPIQKNMCDISLGSRMKGFSETIQEGMPIYKYFGNRMLTSIENLYLSQRIKDYHTGFRAYNRRFLSQVQFLQFSDNFVFDQQMLFIAIRNHFRIGQIDIPACYHPDSSSISFQKSIVYGVQTLTELVKN